MLRLLAVIVALSIAGCGGNASDEHTVDVEQHRLRLLNDPATLAAAAEQPEGPDPARWTGPGASSTTRPTPTTQPVLRLTIQQAVMMALDRNRDLIVQRYGPELTEYGLEGQLGRFDPLLTGSAGYNQTFPGPGQFGSKGITANAAVQEFFPTGTTLNGGFTFGDSGTHLYGDHPNDVTNLRGSLTATQSLLQGAGLRVNLASIRQAQLDVLTSQYQLRGFCETLAGNTETAYINYLLALDVLKIADNALAVAQQQLDQTDGLIRSGRSAPTDRASSVATVAQRHVDVINAQSSLEQARLQLLLYVNGPSTDLGRLWDEQFDLTQPPVTVGPLDDIESHVRVALLYRAELNQARLQVERNDLQVVVTRNGLLPRLDVFLTLGRTWYFHTPVAANGGAATNTNTTSIGGTIISAPGYADGAGSDLEAGVNLSYPILNRAARAAYQSSLASREQSEDAVKNLSQQIELQVRSAYREVIRAQEQITAAAAATASFDAALQVEKERYTVGRSTTILVSLAEQNLINARNTQAVAVASYLKGLVSLYATEGSLLERRGLRTIDYPARTSRP